LTDLAKASNHAVPFALNKKKITIGRDPANDIVIAKDTISSFHATIEFANDYFFVEDHRSTNGTFLNKKKIEQNTPVKLKSGDKLAFAVYEFRFLMLDQAPVGETVLLSSSSFPMNSQYLEKTMMNGEIDDAALFKKCLKQHLDRVGRLGENFDTFVRNHFDEKTMDLLGENAKASMALTQQDLDEHGSELASPPICYQLWALPVEIKHAKGWYAKRHGGYIPFLTHFLNSEPFKNGKCTVLCLIAYGRTKEAWVSMTIVPTGKDYEEVEIISVEFLSEDEKENLSVNFGELGKIVS
jgi:pSer/pThr/pTyr-binding forkhead associated (FHA) protein